MSKKYLVVSVAALGYDLASKFAGEKGADVFPGGRLKRADAVFPAVTCTAQASFRTASEPEAHGMTANGLYDRRWRKSLFWEQASSLVEGERFWDDFRARGKKVGMFFWQQAMGENVDYVITPAPIHPHGGGMILDCYSRPGTLYPRLRAKLGEFKLSRYWGPLATPKVGYWITEAIVDIMEEEAPDLMLLYLPTLDYDLQRRGPGHPRARTSLEHLSAQLRTLADRAAKNGYEILFWGDYAIGESGGPALLPNQSLRKAGLFEVRDVRGRTYPDFHCSRVFALCDHEIAQVYVRDQADLSAARKWAEGFEGVSIAEETGARHPNAGELTLIAPEGRWFAYPWWDDAREAPDYARHIDIHNKPGFDSCELFFNWFPPGVSPDTSRIRGSHGRPGRPVAWGGTMRLEANPANQVELAKALRDYINAG